MAGVEWPNPPGGGVPRLRVLLLSVLALVFSMTVVPLVATVIVGRYQQERLHTYQPIYNHLREIANGLDSTQQVLIQVRSGGPPGSRADFDRAASSLKMQLQGLLQAIGAGVPQLNPQAEQAASVLLAWLNLAAAEVEGPVPEPSRSAVLRDPDRLLLQYRVISSEISRTVQTEIDRLNQRIRWVQLVEETAVVVLGLCGTALSLYVIRLWRNNALLRRLNETQRERLQVVLDLLKQQKGDLEVALVFLRTVLDHVPVGIAVTQGEEHRIRLTNPAFCRLLGVKSGDRIDERPITAVWSGARESDLPLWLQRVYRDGQPYFAPELPLAGGGYCSLHVQPLRTGTGQTEGLVLMVIDTTEQVTARQAIELSARRAQEKARQLETVIQSMSDVVLITSPDGRLLDANQAALRLFDLDGGLLAQASWPELVDRFHVRQASSAPLDWSATPWARAMRGECAVEEFSAHPSSGREMYWSVSAAPVYDAGGQIGMMVLVVRDITEAKRLEQAKDEFLAVASHELRTPLTAVIGYAQLLARRLERRISSGVDRGDAEYQKDREQIAMILEQASRLSQLTSDLLDVSRIDTGRFAVHRAPVDLARLAQAVIRRVESLATGHHILLEVAEPAGDGEHGLQVLGDESRLDQVLTNLINNAVAYSPEGTEITTRVARAGDQVQVSVHDQGIGIQAEHIKRLFDRFYRAGQASVHRRNGLGLGLYISREIIERHGGRLFVESTPGRGSTFTFSLPLLRGSEAVAGGMIDAAPTGEPGHPR